MLCVLCKVGVKVPIRLNAGDIGDGHYTYFASLGTGDGAQPGNVGGNGDAAGSALHRASSGARGEGKEGKEGKEGGHGEEEGGALAGLGPVVQMAARSQLEGQSMVMKCILCKKTQHYVKEEGGKGKLVDAPAVVEGMTLDDVNSAMKAARTGKNRKEIVRLTRLSQKIRAKARSGGEGDPECSHQVCVHCLMDSISPGGGDGYVLP